MSSHSSFRKWSTVVPNTDRPDRGEIRRSFDPLIHPELGVYGCRTLYEGFRRGATLNPLGPCMGFRAVSVTSGMATPYIYSSYSECLARVDSLAAGLQHLRLMKANQDGMKVLALYLPNCVEWVLAEHACYTVGGATCPLYDTLGPETAGFILDQTQAPTVVTSRSQLSKLCEVKAANQCPHFTAVLLVDGVTNEADEMAKAAGLQALSLAKVEAVGARVIATQPSGAHAHHPPNPDDVATFCYTSGTTGNPKGALLTHQNIIAGIAGVYSACPDGEMRPNDRHLSYLPLAHVFERVVMSQLFMVGASVAFYRGDPTLLIQDLQACRPTIIPVAPRVLNKIYDKIQAGIAAAGGLKAKLFRAAMNTKRKALLERGVLKHPFYDRIVFDKIKKGLGMDKLRFMVSGSAPLSENVMIFFRCLLGITIVEGYGQTEGSAVATISHPDDVESVGHVGGPKGCVEVALYDVPEMGYSHLDKEHRGMPCEGRGEICIRGPNVFKGYYREPEKTAEAIDQEGWLHSGDIGLWRPDGTLQIIDRKKNIFKVSLCWSAHYTHGDCSFLTVHTTAFPRRIRGSREDREHLGAFTVDWPEFCAWRLERKLSSSLDCS